MLCEISFNYKNLIYKLNMLSADGHNSQAVFQHMLECSRHRCLVRLEGFKHSYSHFASFQLPWLGLIILHHQWNCWVLVEHFILEGTWFSYILCITLVQIYILSVKPRGRKKKLRKHMFEAYLLYLTFFFPGKHYWSAVLKFCRKN